MRLIDCGCGPGSITVDLAQVLAPGEVVGVDIREEALAHGRTLARDRGISNVTFQEASIYQLPYPDASFDAAFSGAVIQHLAAPRDALREIRRVLKPGGVIGIIDGSAPVTFRYPTNPILDRWDTLRVLDRKFNTGQPPPALKLRALLGEAGFTRTEASGHMSTETGPPAGTPEATRMVAQIHVTQLRGVRGRLALEQGWVTPHELEQMADALSAWGEASDAFYGRPIFNAIGWV